MRFFGRLILLCLLFFDVGSSNLNNKKQDNKKLIGGYSVMGGVMVTPVYSEEEIRFYHDAITELFENNYFNGNVFVARFGTVLYNGSFGYADFNTNTLLNDTTVFQLASIGKTFTAAGVLLLEYRDLITIDDPVIEHIPEFPYDNITIRHLLNHTSGLQNYMWLVENRWDRSVLPDNEDMLSMFVDNDVPLNFYPGRRFDYSNTGYAFLALLIERVTGNCFAEYMEQEIFKPLEMHHSFVKDLHNPRDFDNLAYGHRRFRNRYIHIPDSNIDGILGDKGIYSSMIDLYKWDQALYSNCLLPQNVLHKAFEYGRLNNDMRVNYGLGWRLQTFLDRKVVYHPGRWHGFRTYFRRFVDDNATIIILNNTNRDVTYFIREIQDIIFQDEIKFYTEQKNSTIQSNENSEIAQGGIEK